MHMQVKNKAKRLTMVHPVLLKGHSFGKCFMFGMSTAIWVLHRRNLRSKFNFRNTKGQPIFLKIYGFFSIVL